MTLNNRSMLSAIMIVFTAIAVVFLVIVVSEIVDFFLEYIIGLVTNAAL